MEVRQSHLKEPGSRTTSKSLAQAAEAILNSTLPDGRRAPRWAVDKVVGAGPLGAAGTGAGPLTLSALVWSLLRSGRPVDALKLADRKGMAVLAGAAGERPEVAQSVCYSVLAEAYLLNGRLAEAAAAARFADEYAIDSAPHRFRALSLLAAALVLNGETAPAAGAIGSALELDSTGEWADGSWPLTLAQLQIRLWRSDADGIAEILDTYSRLPNPDAVERALTQIAALWRDMVNGDFRAAVAVASALTNGVDAKLCPPLFTNQAVASQTLALVHLGDPGAALRLLENRVSPPAHSVCFELLRAGVHLQLEEPRKALAVTEVCVRNTPDHNALALPSVLLRRAVAHELLGHHSLADAEFSRSVHLSAQFAGMRAAVSLPLEVLDKLYWRLIANEPEFGAELMRAVPPQDTYPDRAPLGFDLPDQLTKRERVLAEWLTSDLTIAAIAAELHVSVNTVKTQAKSLYRKLGVSSRSEAVERLEASGLIGAELTTD